MNPFVDYTLPSPKTTQVTVLLKKMIPVPVKRPKVPPIRPSAASVVTFTIVRRWFCGFRFCWWHCTYIKSTLWAPDSMLYQPSFPFQSHRKWHCSSRSSQSEHCKAARSLEFRLLIFLKLTFHLHFCCRCWTEYSDQTLFCSFDKPLLLWQAYVWRCDYMGNKNEELFDILVVIDGVAVLIVQYVCIQFSARTFTPENSCW